MGSNKSNSSAVDQILEHYRQKRRDRDRSANGGRATPSSGSASGSVTTGSSPGSSSFAPSPGTVTSGNFSASLGTGTVDVGVSAGATFSAGTRTSQRASINHGRDLSTSDSIGRPENTSSSSISKVPTAPSTALGKNHPRPTDRKNGFISINPQTEDAADHIADHQFLLSNIEATIGPRGVAPDMESLSGRSLSVRSVRDRPSSQYGTVARRMGSGGGIKPHGSLGGSNHHRRTVPGSDSSVDSRTSRGSRASRTSRASHASFRSYQSTRSALTSMSKESRSVANDLFRLEAQLAEQVARQKSGIGGEVGGRVHPAKESAPLEKVTLLGAEPAPRPNTYFTLIAPPGKLGILLSNAKSSRQGNGDSTGPTHVSAVRSTSVLAGKVHVGDIFVSIDGEDVTLMNSKEITNIMAESNGRSRVLRFRPLASVWNDVR